MRSFPFSMPRTRRPSPFPYTTLFRSGRRDDAELLLKHALVPYQQGRYPQALRWIRRGLEALDDAGSGEAAAQRARLTAPGVVERLETAPDPRSEEHTSELQSRENLVC